MEKAGSLVWARNAFRRDRLWPGVVLPEGSVPDFMQRLRTPGRVCVCFYGPSIAQSRIRDYYWLPTEDLMPWDANSSLEQPNETNWNKDHYEALKTAHEEALSVEAGYLDPIQGMLPKVDPSVPNCAACGKAMKSREAATAKEQEDRCNDCQQRFLAGQHCAVCKRVWFDYESESLATCKRCGARVHAGCDTKADKSVKATAVEQVAAFVKHEQQQIEPMDVDHQEQELQQQEGQQQETQQQLFPSTSAPQQPGLAYNCPACCQKEADESRMDLLHLHAVVLADMKPSKARPAAEIFAAELTRKHVSSGGELDLQQLQGLISKAWVEEEDKGKYEQQAQQEEKAYQAAVTQYEALFRQYVNLAASQRRDIDLSLALEPQRLFGSGLLLTRNAAATQSSGLPTGANLLHTGSTTRALGGSSTRSQQQGLLPPANGGAAAAAGSAPQAPAAAAASGDGGGSAARGGRPAHVLGSGEMIKAEDGSDVPQQIPIICNTTRATFLLAEMKVVCSCTSCATLPPEKRIFSPTQFEQHAGAGSAKKWKASLRIEPGAVRECPAGANPMAFGKWMDIKGIEAKGSKSSAAHVAMSAAEVAQLLLDGPAASVKREPRTEQHSQQSRQAQQGSTGPAASADGVLAPSGAGGPSPASSSKGPGDGAAAGGGAGGTAATSSGDHKPATTGVPKNRRPDSWAPWEDVNLGQYKPIQVKFAGDRCCVCDSDVDFDVDRLVSCDGCGITVHQSCYGIPELPDEDDMWLCRSCELKEPGAAEPQCCLCPMTGGGLKPTTLPGMWAHAACMQWIPEVSCLEPMRMEPISRIEHIQKERWELLCCICRQRMGAKIQCNDCYQAYHPLCARRVGLHMEMAESGEPGGPLQVVTYCPRHCKPQPEKTGITLVNLEDGYRTGRPRKRLNDAAAGTSSGAAAGGLNSSAAADPNNMNGLWNAQPFRCNKPPAQIPVAPGGCARATAFSAKQISHGTGTGRTSVAGFWIPTAEEAVAAAAVSEGGGPCSSSTTGAGVGRQGSITSSAAAAATTATAVPAGKHGRKRRRWGRSSSAKIHSSRPASRPRVPKLSASGEPPPEVDLLPLPDGVPDRVPVVCNGKPAVFVVRPQRVLLGDQEITASRFEAMCGKGDAKKWKSSLWAATADGEPDVSMGDWLAARKMDKAVLAKLASNWAAHELRQAWLRQQQEQKAKGAAAGVDQQQQDDDGDEEEAGDDDAEPTSGGVTDGVTTEDGEEVTDGDMEQDQQQQQVGDDQQVEAVEEEIDADEPTAKKQKTGAAEEATGEADKQVPVNAAAVDDSAAAADFNAANAVTPQQQQQQQDTAAVLLQQQAVVPEPQQPQQVQQLQDNSVIAEAVEAGIIATAADGGGGVADEVTAHEADKRSSADATAARREKGLVLLLRMHYKQLPDSFKVHPSSLPQQTATAQVQQPEQQQANTAAAAAVAGSSEGEQISAASNPWSVIGRCCRMYWPDDDAWYEADVTGYDSSSKQHKLWYHIDEVSEDIDLVQEEKQGRVQWLPLADKIKWPKAPQKNQEEEASAAAGGAWGGTAADGVMTSGMFGWQQAAAVTGGGGILLQQQLQQQQLLMQLAAAGVQMQQSQADPAAAVQQAAQLPAGFPRITAMSRNPLDTAGVNLLQLAASNVNLQQQMQRMLQQQQEQYMEFSAAQPDPAPTALAAVGWRVGIFCQHAGAFYYGQITAYDNENDSHIVQYDDGVSASVRLSESRLDWVSADGQDMGQAGQQMHQDYMKQRLITAAEQQQQNQLQQQMSNSNGQQVLLLQLQLQQIQAEIQQLGLQPGMQVPLHLQQRLQQVLLALQQHQQQQLLQQQQHMGEAGTETAAADAGGHAAAAAGGGKSGPKPGAPTRVDIICGTNTAVFDCTRMAVMNGSGGYISPTEFERLSGKGSSKKWKCTIRVRKANGLPGITMGDWLIQMGYDQPKQPSAAGGEGSGRVRTSLNDIRRQYASRSAAQSRSAAAAPKPRAGSSSAAADNGRPSSSAGQTVVTARGVALHREGCMCVICKQARRKAAQEAGMAPNPEDAYVPRQPGEGKPGPSSSRPAAGRGSYTKPVPARSTSLVVQDGALIRSDDLADQRRKKLNLPPVLVGKRAYVRAVPQLVRGAAVHQPWEIPESRSFTAEEWEAMHSGKSAAAEGAVSGDTGAAAAAGSRAGTPSIGNSRPSTPLLPAAAGDDETAAAAEDGEVQDKQLVQQQQSEKSEKKGSRSQTWREKLRVCQTLEPKRITFGKSGIHGWGIFARASIPQDTMVTEFRGQLVRCILADVREHKYRKEHRDCYMFHATDETVIDNTKGGNYARFTNHCCFPCLYAKPLELGGELHLCFFARVDIKKGQELTFDYRFKEEEGDDKIICQCGAPNCKGTLN